MHGEQCPNWRQSSAEQLVRSELMGCLARALGREVGMASVLLERELRLDCAVAALLNETNRGADLRPLWADARVRVQNAVQNAL